MRLAYVLLLSVLVASVAVAAPGHVDEKPWSYPDGFYGYRDVLPEQEPNDTCPSIRTSSSTARIAPRW
mgnify:CR=1 FL=1